MKKKQNKYNKLLKDIPNYVITSTLMSCEEALDEEDTRHSMITVRMNPENVEHLITIFNRLLLAEYRNND